MLLNALTTCGRGVPSTGRRQLPSRKILFYSGKTPSAVGSVPHRDGARYLIQQGRRRMASFSCEVWSFRSFRIAFSPLLLTEERVFPFPAEARQNLPPLIPFGRRLNVSCRVHAGSSRRMASVRHDAVRLR